MSERSVAPPARTTSPPPDKELLADAVEEALARLRAARPHLESRLDRAATIVVADFHRRGAACKHGIAAWILANAGTRTTPQASDEAAQGNEDGKEVAGVPAGAAGVVVGLTHAEVGRWLESRRWIFARSRPTNPHSYCLRREAGDEAIFEAVVEHIREFGQPYPWWGTVYLQYVAGSHTYWTMGAAVKDTILINRKTLEQVRLDQLTNKGGGGIVWPWLHQDVEAEREALRRQESGQDELSGGGA